jgi:hypothetical protein
MPGRSRCGSSGAGRASLASPGSGRGPARGRAPRPEARARTACVPVSTRVKSRSRRKPREAREAREAAEAVHDPGLGALRPGVPHVLRERVVGDRRAVRVAPLAGRRYMPGTCPTDAALSR